ncbi:hypothetical protein GCM10007920_28850 [Ciceribacter naphthalenivorans]|uniref:Uncharacterized protein n=2 Tax=Alphaproteobacteria TaxID=28211 RepID=A0A512HPJ9_9HYPH|nr:hypothetical protein RNA01_43200 [Ciceribacter naphthalenivorans]GLR23097.1 hypothetical protein GCM10007920_28850 [Ciceribacter naphthalenivorans]GLT05953.1 hypothetical protein GCM10007926_28850 [Sphingomonas psychrolutea]
MKPDKGRDRLRCGREWNSFQKHDEAKNIALLVAERIEPASSLMRDDDDIAATPVFDGASAAFLHIEFVSGLLKHCFATDLGAQRL